MSAYLRTITAAHEFSGAVLVAKDGVVMFRDAFGLADAAAKTANTPSTRFRIGSVTKQFTALAVMQLVHDGSLGLQDRLCDRLADCPAAWTTITIDQLLTHTSGIPDYIPTISVEDFDGPMAPRDVVALVRDRPLLFTPGDEFGYSNTNYELLGLLVERVSGLDWGAYLRTRILDPLGLHDSGYERDFSRVATAAIGYGYKTRDETESVPRGQAAYAAGGMYSTVDDLLRWDLALDAARPLPADELARMVTAWGGARPAPARASRVYGYGWYVTNGVDGRLASHGGGIPGFGAANYRYLDDHVQVIVLSNFYWSDPEGVARTLAQIIRGPASFTSSDTSVGGVLICGQETATVSALSLSDLPVVATFPVLVDAKRAPAAVRWIAYQSGRSRCPAIARIEYDLGGTRALVEETAAVPGTYAGASGAPSEPLVIGDKTVIIVYDDVSRERVTYADWRTSRTTGTVAFAPGLARSSALEFLAALR